MARSINRELSLKLDSLEDRAVPATFTVNDDGGADFTSIQAAIDAAAGNGNPGQIDRIVVQDGTYTETLNIAGEGLDRVRILNASGASPVVVAPAGTTGPVVDISDADRVLVRGLTIDGQGSAGVSAEAGLLIQDGASATIRGNTITDLFDGVDTNQDGDGVQVREDSSAKIILNTITDYQKSGVLLEGVGTSAIVRGNTITGVGLTDVVAQNGVDIQDGASGRVVRNTITGNDFDDVNGTGFAGSGVLFLNDAANPITSRTVVGHNTINNNGVGVFVVDYTTVKVVHNLVTDNALDGILLLGADDNKVIGNISNRNGGDNLEVVEDFETFAKGDTVDGDDSAFEFFTVTTNDSNKPARIFDTTDPSGSNDGNDLGQLPELGNILIVDKDGVGDPDDNAGGGTLTFDYFFPSRVEYVDVVDIDTNETVTVTAKDVNGSVLFTETTTGNGDATVKRLDVNSSNVTTLEVVLSSSGAVAEVKSAFGGIGGGITLFDSSDVDIIGNVANENALDGIFVNGGGNNQILFDLTANNTFDGIRLEDTTNNVVQFNAAVHNGGNGISLINADDNTVRFNASVANGDFGIFVDANSTGNLIDDNFVDENEDADVEIAGVDGSSDTWTSMADETEEGGDLAEDDDQY